MKKIVISKLNLNELNLNELINIDGGDVDGLMRAKGPDLDKLGRAVHYCAHQVSDFFASFCSTFNSRLNENIRR